MSVTVISTSNNNHFLYFYRQHEADFLKNQMVVAQAGANYKLRGESKKV